MFPVLFKFGFSLLVKCSIKIYVATKGHMYWTVIIVLIYDAWCVGYLSCEVYYPCVLHILNQFFWFLFVDLSTVQFSCFMFDYLNMQLKTLVELLNSFRISKILRHVSPSNVFYN